MNKDFILTLFQYINFSLNMYSIIIMIIFTFYKEKYIENVELKRFSNNRKKLYRPFIMI